MTSFSELDLVAIFLFLLTIYANYSGLKDIRRGKISGFSIYRFWRGPFDFKKEPMLAWYTLIGHFVVLVLSIILLVGALIYD